MNKKFTHFIDGKMVSVAGDRVFLDEYDPRTGEVSYSILRGTGDDLDRAAVSAEAALRTWKKTSALERGRILTGIARAIRENVGELAEIEQRETGKPMSKLHNDIEIVAQYFEFYGGLAPTVNGDALQSNPAFHIYTLREPYGIVGVITPWNAPLSQAARGIAPALAAGNVVICKPSEFTSVSTIELARLAVEAGLPAGVLNVVTGIGSEIGAALVAHSSVKKIAFTGSVRAGREIGRMAADRIIPVTLELGGKSPNIVFEDADLEKAAAGVVNGFTSNSGQACIAGTRCLVQESIYPRFVEMIRAKAANIRVERDEAGGIGPIITKAQFEKIGEYFDIAREEGAETLIGGEVTAGTQGWYVSPTIYTNVSNSMRIAQEEIFGPVLAVLTFAEEADAIRMANDSDYALGAGIWTTDISRAHRVAGELEAGQVYVNTYLYGGVDAPFGGSKASGHGREKGIEALYHYTHVKTVLVKL